MLPQVAQSDSRSLRSSAIRIRGARVHNLKNLDLDIPRDQLVVITGPSGSGKSSLALDTIYAEGQRQYIESLSVYARQFLHQLQRPEVDLVEGLEATICIDQRPGLAGPRSTVGTATEIYDYLRLLMARLGEVFCYKCGRPVRQQTPEQIQDRLMALPEGTRAMILAPMVRGRRGGHKEVFSQIRKAGFVRVRVDGQVLDVDEVPPLEPRRNHQIDAVVDRVVIRSSSRGRLGESIRTALDLADGLVGVCYLDTSGESENEDGAARSGRWCDELYSTRYACPQCNVNLEEIEPRTFSFNSPYGACPACDGLGRREQFDPDLVLPDRRLSLAEGAIAPWRDAPAAERRKMRAALEPFVKAHRLDWKTPLARLQPRLIHKLLFGDNGFLGVLGLLEQQYATTTARKRLERLAAFRGQITCPACGGSRLRPEATSVRLGGKAIHEITRLSIDEVLSFLHSLDFPPAEQPIAQPVLQEISRRLEFLVKVGLPYLTLDRAADTLSGGELQRVRLASSIGSGLVGVCYVLDEPSIGLHQRDNQRLIDALRDLQQCGNSVLVVEHDEMMMRQADWLIDMGPGAGAEGGHVVAVGTPEQVAGRPESLTGQYLSGKLQIPLPPRRRPARKSRAITLSGVATNNLKNIDVRFPLGLFLCVTGVSGSGKSSLINETLAPALLRRRGQVAPKPGPFKSLRGAAQIDKVISIDQSPIGRTPRSNAATYTGVFDEIRKVFANTRQARQLGFRASRFSFNVRAGWCEACQGQGTRRIEMHFLPDLYVSCEACGGARFNRQTLQVEYRGRTIAQVLEMSVTEGRAFFDSFPSIVRVLESLVDVGLGYLPLGQPSTTLSGGEAQRIKLATQLARPDTGHTLYLLDEPTVGLHPDDIRRLLRVLDRLVDKGNTVIVIEHHPDIIKCADWIIDLGPEGGEGGGHVVAAGTPEEVAQHPDSHTGRYLVPLLGERLQRS